MDNSLQKYIGRELKDAIQSMQVVQGQAKNSGYSYYAIDITFINGYKQRIFLRGAEAYAWTSAFDLITVNKQVESAF